MTIECFLFFRDWCFENIRHGEYATTIFSEMYIIIVELIKIPYAALEMMAIHRAPFEGI